MDPTPADKSATVLVVDDTSDNLSLLSCLLKDRYTVKVANNGEKAIRIAQTRTAPDLILLDVMMPGVDGYVVCRLLKENPDTRDIPIIFLTALSDSESEKKALELGAADFITKPINPPVVLARVATQLQAKAAADFLKNQNSILEREVAQRTQELTAIQNVTILTMASLAETRDNETGNHICRTQHYIKALGERLKKHPRFSHYLTDEMIDLLFKSAPLHDLGKVGIPDRILLKPAQLTEEEFEIMKTHTTLGRDAIQASENRLGLEVDFLRIAKEIAYSHQEKWDGTGYPQGIGGDDIPICARLMAVADVYDALISKRVYKPAFTHDAAVTIMVAGRGTHFDPDVLDAFLALQDEFIAIAERFADEGTPPPG